MTIFNESDLYNKERMLRFGTSFLWGYRKNRGHPFHFPGLKFYEALSQLLTEGLVQCGTIVPECG